MEVAFGNAKNFRSKILSFEVVKFKSPYHVILGRPAYARFMARPCYIYLKLKIPGPYGVITVDGNREISLACEKDDVTYAEAACAEERHRALPTANLSSPKGSQTDPVSTPLEQGPSNQ